jgi:hypothetical protein
VKNLRTIVFSAAAICLTTLLFAFNNCGRVAFNNTPAATAAAQFSFASSSALIINDGAPYTNNQLVQLGLNSPRATDMKISNQPDCSDGSWEPFLTSKVWTLSKTNANVSVYAQYKGLDGLVTSCISASIIHDDVPPQASFSSAQNVYVNALTTPVSFTASDNLSGVDQILCTDPAGVSAACMNVLNVTNAAEGARTVKVRVTDKAGNVSPDFIYSWVYDKTPPLVAITSAPPTLTSSSSATVVFTASDVVSGVAQILCSMDGASYSVCVSPLNMNSLSVGGHTVQVKAVDKTGNESSPVSASWTIDMTAPSIRFTQTPDSYSNSSSGTFAFDGSKNGQPITIFQCHLDAAAFSSCTSPKTLTGLTEGTHSFEFRGVDSLGNVSVPLKYTWVVDFTAPVITFTQAPAALNNMVTANVQWTSTDALSGVKAIECRLDGAAYAACPGSASYSGLAPGAHHVDVRVTDNAGNVATGSRAWTIDLTPPSVQIISHPNPFVSATTAAFGFSASDVSGIAGYECRVDNATYAACTSPNPVSNIAEGSHVFYVRASDKAGNVSDPATYTWTVDLTPPIIQIISAPSTLRTTDHAVIHYKVVDLASGVASVNCGLTVPSGSTSACQVEQTVDLGTLAVASYGFKIQATDNVGNAFSTVVNFQVTAVPLVCDPFTVGGDATCSGGLVGNIYYLDANGQKSFQALSTKTVDYFINSGIQVNAILNLKQLFVSTRSFTSGFPTNSGSLVTDNSGNALYSYFAFDLKTVFKLDSANNQPGWYQFATLSDDGSVVTITPQGSSTVQTLVSSDGDHPTRMGCSTQAIYVDDTTRLAMRIKYYQGPPTEIALVMMWKRVSGPTAALDASCGATGNNTFFGPPPYTDFTSTNSGYAQLLSRGWSVLAPGNFIAPP